MMTNITNGTPHGSADLAELLRTHFGTSSLTGEISVSVSRSYEEYVQLRTVGAEQLNYRLMLESDLAAATRREPQRLAGVCRVCRQATRFAVNMEYSDGHTPNWRERLNCETCGLNTRLRMCLDVFMALNVRGQASRAYITEQVTSTYTLLRKRCETVGSEYIGGGLSSGEVRNGIRNEDLTALSFEDRSFDLVLTFDVLEHIPQAGAALTEIARVLKPDGWLVLTAPFDVNARKNLRRAYIDESGTTVHLEPPDYHGDPINPDVGILCYWWFGWELLSDLRAAGFSDAAVLTAWSAEAGYLGQSLPMVVARR